MTSLIWCLHGAVGIAPWLRTGRCSFRLPTSANNFSLLENVGTDSGVHPASYIMSTGDLSSPGKSGRGLKLTTDLILMTRLLCFRCISAWPEQGKLCIL